jgi:hypothetical protein
MSDPQRAETLKTINKREHDKSLCDYIKHFFNTRNVIMHIQDIEVINTLHDGITDLKTLAKIAMKKPKTWQDCLRSSMSA